MVRNRNTGSKHSDRQTAAADAPQTTGNCPPSSACATKIASSLVQRASHLYKNYRDEKSSRTHTTARAAKAATSHAQRQRWRGRGSGRRRAGGGRAAEPLPRVRCAPHTTHATAARHLAAFTQEAKYAWDFHASSGGMMRTQWLAQCGAKTSKFAARSAHKHGDGGRRRRQHRRCGRRGAPRARHCRRHCAHMRISNAIVDSHVLLVLQELVVVGLLVLLLLATR